MRLRTGIVGWVAAAVLAGPASAAIMIDTPVRQPVPCFSASAGCEAGNVVAPAPVDSSELPPPALAGIVGLLALGLAVVRRPRGLQEVVC